MISEPATDAAGAAGLGGRTDHDWDRAFAAAGDESERDLERAVRRGVSDTVSRAGDRVVDQQLGVQPTLRIAQGTPVRVLVTRDLVLRPYPEHSP